MTATDMFIGKQLRGISFRDEFFGGAGVNQLIAVDEMLNETVCRLKLRAKNLQAIGKLKIVFLLPKLWGRL